MSSVCTGCTQDGILGYVHREAYPPWYTGLYHPGIHHLGIHYLWLTSGYTPPGYTPPRVSWAIHPGIHHLGYTGYTSGCTCLPVCYTSECTCLPVCYSSLRTVVTLRRVLSFLPENSGNSAQSGACLSLFLWENGAQSGARIPVFNVVNVATTKRVLSPVFGRNREQRGA